MCFSMTRPARRSRHAGFTLIELMVVVAVIAISVALVGPSFSQAIANYQVRSAAESILNGLSYARGEAVRRNSAVSFALVAGGSGWTVSQVTPNTVLQTRSNNDSPRTTVASSNTATAVTFLPTGLVDTTSTPLTQATVTSSVASTDSRRINIYGGGLIRMCDPGISTANDPRRC
jgi:type IV fimbrial biogenesis protein FimT